MIGCSLMWEIDAEVVCWLGMVLKAGRRYIHIAKGEWSRMQVASCE